MKIRDIYNAKAVALRINQNASNAIQPLGRTFFPSTKKMGLDLSWIKTANGLPVSLAPSAFDTKSAIRGREGLKTEKTQMAFFRESMLVSEEDEQEIMRVQESTDPYAQAVIDHVYGDAETLVKGADVVPERMIWQLLAPATGTPKIYISSGGATYEYNYDPNGTFVANNFKKLTGTSRWSDTTNSDPIEDVREAQEAIQNLTGETPTNLVISQKTLGYLLKNAKLKGQILAQNVTANIFMTETRVKEFFMSELGVTVLVYRKKYKNEAGVAANFYPDDFATLLPDHAIGKTWYGTTPEERVLLGDANADVAIVNTGVAVTITTTNDPVNTKTTVSEIVLPSFEGADSVYVLDVATSAT